MKYEWLLKEPYEKQNSKITKIRGREIWTEMYDRQLSTYFDNSKWSSF